MLDFIRRSKLSYSLYNFFHRKQLIHNEAIYRALCLNKKYYSPVSSADFKSLPGGGAAAEIVRSFAEIQADPLFSKLDPASQEALRDWERDGFLILRGFFSPEIVGRINAEISTLLEEKKIHWKFGNKLMFAIKRSAFLKSIGADQRLMNILSLLLNREAVLFQSINFYMGSEQKTHSDSIHMTTYPLGNLSAAWVALEDIGTDNGPLHYYPGSHLLPYYMNSDYDNEGSKWMIGEKDYSAYEQFIEKKMKEVGLEKKVFMAKAGDVLIWHANLFHGGEPHINKSLTRKSMVFHYFSKGVVCYHEITQRPALIETL